GRYRPLHRHQPRDHGPGVGVVVRRGRQGNDVAGGRHPGQGVVAGGVVVGRPVGHGADQAELVGAPRQARQVFADLEARDGGRNRVELAADLVRGGGFHVEGFELALPALQEKQDAGPGPAPVGGAGPLRGAEQVRQAQPGGADGPQAQEVSAGGGGPQAGGGARGGGYYIGAAGGGGCSRGRRGGAGETRGGGDRAERRRGEGGEQER